MFLIPSLGATISDCLVILLHHDFSSHLSHENVWSIENTTYLTFMSFARLLLLLPLIYHTYSGNRLRFPKVYLSFHVCSAIVVTCHFCAFSIMTIEEAISKSNTITHEEDIHMTDKNEKKQYDSKEMDIIWTLLILSLIAITLHIIILFHVRSTAPTNDAITRKFEGAQRVNSSSVGKSRKMLAYWIYDRYRRGNYTAATDAIPLPMSGFREDDSVRTTRNLNHMDDANGLENFNPSSPNSCEYRDESYEMMGDEHENSQLRRRDHGRSVDHAGVNLGNIVGSLSEGYDGMFHRLLLLCSHNVLNPFDCLI